MKPIINHSIKTLKESSTLAINQKVKELRKKGESVVHFGFGQSPFEVAPQIQDALKENSHQKEYLPTLGLPELRKAFCDFYNNLYGYEYDPEFVVVGPGSKELIFQAIFVLEGPLLIPAPSWVSYGPQAHIRGKPIIPIQTQFENGYKLTAQELDEVCKTQIVNRQKILIVNNPNNPTGNIYTKSELDSLSEVCREHGVVVISDEIYSLVNFSTDYHSSFAMSYPEGTIMTGGLSKGHSAGGYRLGVLAAPNNFNELINGLKAMVSETYSSVSAPTQFAAVKAYSGDPDIMKYIDQCTSVHKATGEYLCNRFRNLGMNCVEPKGAFYLFPDFQNFASKIRKRGIENSEELAHFLLDNYKVAVLPGSDFYLLPDIFGVRVATVDYDGKSVLDSSWGKDLNTSFVEKHCPNLKLGCDRLDQFINDL